MPYSFPRAMPTKGASAQSFEIQRVDFQAPEAGGYLGGVQAGFPLWAASWNLGRMGRDASDEWRAFVASLRGSQRRFYGRDLGRPYPKAYPAGFSGMTRAGGGAFDGSATSWSQAIDAEGNAVLTLNGLPASFQIGTGDYVGFRWDDGAGAPGNKERRTLMRALEPVTGNGSGVAIFSAEPPLPSWVGAGVQAHLDNPACVMAIISGDTRLGPIDRRLAVQGGTITALQDLRP